MKAVHHLAAALEHVACAGEELVHEDLDPLQNRLVPVAEVRGDDALQAERELVRRTLLGVMHLIAHAQQKVVGLFEFAQTFAADQIMLDEILQVRCAQLRIRHPDQVLVIAQPAAARFHVGLLNERRVFVLGVACGEVALAKVKKFNLATDHALLVVALLQLIEGFRLSREQTCLDQRGLRLIILVREAERFADRTRGASDFEIQVIEEEQELPDYFLCITVDDRVITWKQQQQVDIAARIHDRAAIAARGDHADR